MRDQLAIAALAAASSAGVGIAVLLVRPQLIRASVQQSFVTVALVALLGLLAAAKAMFLSEEDFRGCAHGHRGHHGRESRVRDDAGRSSDPRFPGLRDAARELGVRGTYTQPRQTATLELREVSAELSQASRRLGEAREHERAMERSRSELIAWVSHDLSTPLAGMRAMAEA